MYCGKNSTYFTARLLVIDGSKHIVQNVGHFGHGHFGLGLSAWTFRPRTFRPLKMPKVDVSAKTINCWLGCVHV